MAFEVDDYLDLIRLLQEHPEWRAELRRLLLTEELLALPELVRDLVHAQRQTQEHLAALAEAQRRIEQQVEALTQQVQALAEAQRRTEERVSRVEEELAKLAEAQRRTEERVSRVEEELVKLAEAQRRTEERVSRVEEELVKLAEAQRRTEERVSRVEEELAKLAEAQRRTEERVSRVEEELAKLAEAQRRTEERVSRVEEELVKLAEAQRRTEEEVRALAEAQRRTEQRVGHLEEALQVLIESHKRLTDVVGDLRGRVLEQTYRDRAGAYFGPLLQRLRVVDPYALEEVLRVHLTADEFYDLLRVDLLVCGQPRLRPEMMEVWLVVEISAVVDQGDVERAQRRAKHLRRAGYRAIPMVAGERVTSGAEDEVRRHRVAVLQDGSVSFWEEALEAWAGSA